MLDTVWLVDLCPGTARLWARETSTLWRTNPFSGTTGQSDVFIVTSQPVRISVSLPWEQFQEIKRMMMMHSTHGLFSTSTQNLIYIYMTYNQSSIKKTPLWKRKKRKETQMFLEVWYFAHGGKSPSTLIPCLVATAPPLILIPFTPLPPLQPHYTIYSDDINNHGLLHLGQ